MFRFEYDIKLNENGRPYISPTTTSSKEMNTAEHKFMAIEMTRAIITSTINLHEKDPIKRPLQEDELIKLKYLENEISRISNIFSSIIIEQFKILGLADQLLNNEFDITVLTIDERDALNYNGIIFNDKIFTRSEGLKVKVIETGQIFELVGGIDNQHWTLKNG